MSERARPDLIGAHYGQHEVLAAIRAGLAAIGKADGPLTPDDLAPADQFHTRGKFATLELAERAGVSGAAQILDLGGGIGGAARLLAARFGCRVEVLDLTEGYCRAGAYLTERCGLADLVSFRHGSALEPPYDGESFDLVWTQHSSMNIADKERLYAEARRVLRPGGRLAIHEILAGPAGPVHFPVPWASDPAISFLRPPEAIRALIGAAGFRELIWHDETAEATRWFEERVPAAASPSPAPFGLHLLLGQGAPAMFRNLLRNLQEGRVVVVQAVFERV